eukprot:GHVT01040225.1.p2 GENE.GHVT01040225.1~~GHVT01040225.1.p2  ORF type:complete len:132 (-),score=17.23 GHVT01040225.1:1005-1400(-)
MPKKMGGGSQPWSARLGHCAPVHGGSRFRRVFGWKLPASRPRHRGVSQWRGRTTAAGSRCLAFFKASYSSNAVKTVSRRVRAAEELQSGGRTEKYQGGHRDESRGGPAEERKRTSTQDEELEPVQRLKSKG